MYYLYELLFIVNLSGYFINNSDFMFLICKGLRLEIAFIITSLTY